VGVLALQGAFEEHQKCLESAGCRTKQVTFLCFFLEYQLLVIFYSIFYSIFIFQVRTAADMEDLDGIVLPGGESTAMGLIGTSSIHNGKNIWEALQEFVTQKPVWGTCAGMILLAERCVGASAVIENGQSLIGGMDILVCRNYFGSQVSSFEMATPAPPNQTSSESYPGVFIRAPAILSAGNRVKVLGRVVATPCRQAAVVLQELETKIKNGEQVVQMGVIDALERKDQSLNYKVVVQPHGEGGEEKKEVNLAEDSEGSIMLPGAADGSNARDVICAVQNGNILCTAFHPELTEDYRWHSYFADMVRESKA
jgi:5'-phosphate synthase pdxT subunit